MKRIIFLLLFVSIIFIIYSVNYFNQYHIEDKTTSIQSELKEWINRGSGLINLEVLKKVQLDDTSSYIVSFQTKSGNIGYAQLIKGWNGKFKIVLAGHGDGEYVADYQKIKTSDGIYGVLVGRNPDRKIDHIIADLDDEEFKFTSNVSGEKTYVKYHKLPPDIEKPFPARVTLYDKNNTEIYPPDLFQ
ncbi:hypothetical protein SAMN05421743_11279 [Thalassobacillus cyri]|uniref:Uncharacterized protein n=1 Tax=Thalassobacillus cyri TaxID=571932 RepID=A0A1H4FTB0_9BACI|nr:hypothetical protein [Thalassobacillus cyri]SEA99762.1 hypothetical protein SAMN05421743_11279 [Thalassobacillus cyri]